MKDRTETPGPIRQTDSDEHRIARLDGDELVLDLTDFTPRQRWCVRTVAEAVLARVLPDVDELQATGTPEEVAQEAERRLLVAGVSRG